MLLQLEQECLEVYRRKVDNASHNRALLHKTIADAEGEFAALFSALGELTLCQRVSVLVPPLILQNRPSTTISRFSMENSLARPDSRTKTCVFPQFIQHV